MTDGLPRLQTAKRVLGQSGSLTLSAGDVFPVDAFYLLFFPSSEEAAVDVSCLVQNADDGQSDLVNGVIQIVGSRCWPTPDIRMQLRTSSAHQWLQAQCLSLFFDDIQNTVCGLETVFGNEGPNFQKIRLGAAGKNHR
jgi:hypothetical protein